MDWQQAARQQAAYDGQQAARQQAEGDERREPRGEWKDMTNIVQNDLIFKCAGCSREVSVICLEALHMPVGHSPFRVKDGKTYCDSCWKALK